MPSAQVSGASTPSTVASKPLLSHPCFECGLMFANKDDHEHHDLVFHNAEDRITLLVCDLCGRTFENAAKLGHHQFEHDLCLLAKALYEHEAKRALDRAKYQKTSNESAAHSSTSATTKSIKKKSSSSTKLPKKSKKSISHEDLESSDEIDDDDDDDDDDEDDDDDDDDDEFNNSDDSSLSPPVKKSKKSLKSASSVAKQMTTKSDQSKQINNKKRSTLPKNPPAPTNIILPQPEIRQTSQSHVSKDVKQELPKYVGNDHHQSKDIIGGDNSTSMNVNKTSSHYDGDKERPSTTANIRKGLEKDRSKTLKKTAAPKTPIKPAPTPRLENKMMPLPTLSSASSIEAQSTFEQQPAPVVTPALKKSNAVTPSTTPRPMLTAVPTLPAAAAAVAAPSAPIAQGPVMLSSICPNCNKNYGKPWCLIEHMISAHDAQLVRLERKFVAGDSTATVDTYGQTRCQYCFLQCDEISACLNHIVRIHRDKLFECAAFGECEVCFELLSSVGAEVSKRKFTIRVKVKRRPNAGSSNRSPAV